ncbi:MAG: hypothetical protein ABIQ36_08435 [Rhodanobacter sp.]
MNERFNHLDEEKQVQGKLVGKMPVDKREPRGQSAQVAVMTWRFATPWPSACV